MKEREKSMNEEKDNSNEDINDEPQDQIEIEDISEIENDSVDIVESEIELSGDLEENIEDMEESEAERALENELEGTSKESAVQVSDKESAEIDLRIIQKNLIEGALYASGSPLTIEEIATKLEISKRLVEDLIKELAYEYLDRSSALVIAQVGERYQMQLRPEYTESVSKFAKGGAIAEKYLRTLTIIALKQPILKSTVVKIRGTGAYEHVKYLLDNELITAEKKGRSSELKTTDKYADMFGLPKNREELKRTMISQLGLDEVKQND